MPSARGIGSEYEDRAADYLTQNGFLVLSRRVKVRGGELDLVALDGDMVVFVEVKYRSVRLTDDTITSTKLDHLRAAAAQYCAQNELENRSCRFDLIAFEGDKMRHWKDVFQS